jgi:hypothetical protein
MEEQKRVKVYVIIGIITNNEYSNTEIRHIEVVCDNEQDKDKNVQYLREFEGYNEVEVIELFLNDPPDSFLKKKAFLTKGLQER